MSVVKSAYSLAPCAPMGLSRAGVSAGRVYTEETNQRGGKRKHQAPPPPPSPPDAHRVLSECCSGGQRAPWAAKRECWLSPPPLSLLPHSPLTSLHRERRDGSWPFLATKILKGLTFSDTQVCILNSDIVGEKSANGV